MIAPSSASEQAASSVGKLRGSSPDGERTTITGCRTSGIGRTSGRIGFSLETVGGSTAPGFDWLFTTGPTLPMMSPVGGGTVPFDSGFAEPTDSSGRGVGPAVARGAALPSGIVPPAAPLATPLAAPGLDPTL